MIENGRAVRVRDDATAQKAYDDVEAYRGMVGKVVGYGTVWNTWPDMYSVAFPDPELSQGNFLESELEVLDG